MLADIKDIERELCLRQRNEGKLFWKTKDGKEISIKDLTDERIRNILKMQYNSQEKEEDNVYEGISGYPDYWED